MAKNQKIEYIEVEGVKCEIKNPRKKRIVEYYQDNLRQEIDNYIGSIERWSEGSRNYRDNLKINVIIAPFVLGWLRKPEDNDEYLVIKGYMTLDELKAKRKKEANKGKKKTTKRKPAISKKSDSIAKKQDSPKKPAAPKKPASPKKPVAPKKPTIKSIAKKRDSPQKKQDSPKKKSDSKKS